MVGHRLVPQLGSEGVVGQALGVLAQAVPIESLDGRRDRRVNRASAVLQEAAVRHLVRERMLERVLRIGEKARLVEELGGPKVRELPAHLVFGDVRDGVQEVEGHILADDGGALEEALVLRGESIDAGR